MKTNSTSSDNNSERDFVERYQCIRSSDYSSIQRQLLYSDLVAHSPYIKQLIEVVCRTYQISELASDVLYFTWEKARRCRFPIADCITSYMFTAIRNHARSIRKATRKEEAETRSLSEDQLSDQDVSASTRDFRSRGITFRIAEGKSYTITHADLWSAIYKLEQQSPIDATCIKLRLADATIDDVANAMGLNYNSAHSICDRAKRRLKKILERENQG